MKLSEDIRALLIFLVVMGAIGGVIVMAIVVAPVINKYPQMSLRLIVALLLTFVTAKFFFYIAEALLVVIGKRSERAAARIRSTHPALRIVLIVTAMLAAFVGWYFVIHYLKGIF
jgi:phosphate/sulfate permease